MIVGSVMFPIVYVCLCRVDVVPLCACLSMCVCSVLSLIVDSTVRMCSVCSVIGCVVVWYCAMLLCCVSY